MLRRVLPAVCVWCLPGVSWAQSALSVTWPTGEVDPATALVSLDLDDDDDDGVPDSEQAQPSPADDEVIAVQVRGATTGAVRVETTGAVRVVGPDGARATATVAVENGVASVRLMGVAASERDGDASVTITAGDARRRVAVTVVGAVFLRGDNGVVFPHRDALAVSHEVTSNETLPRSARWRDASPDVDNVRAEVWDPGARSAAARVESLATGASVGMATGSLRAQLTELAMARPDAQTPWRSGFLRLVGDELDLRAPGVQGQTLRVGLRDRVRLRYRRAGVAGEVTHDARVGRPGNEDGPLAARAARWNIVLPRDHVGGRVLVGDTDDNALRIGRRQVEISNEIYVQCMVTWGDPEQASVRVVDPPASSLLAVGDDDGLRAMGGEVRFRAGARAIGPVQQRAGWSPVDTASAIARALREAGFTVRLTQNTRTDYGADGGADLVVRDAQGRLVTLAPMGDAPLSTDARQRVQIGAVDFTDGIDEFNNLNSSSGTLEERSLIKPLMDDDVTTVDMFVINRFARGTRIGEAFVEGDSGAILNGLLIDRMGISAEREAWTQSHEVGHILLNQPWHPDNLGPDRPWLLMDADANLGAVTGPKRLSVEECARIRDESGPGRAIALLRRYDVAHPAANAATYRAWPTRAPYPRDAAPERDAAGAATQAEAPLVRVPGASVGVTFERE